MFRSLSFLFFLLLLTACGPAALPAGSHPMTSTATPGLTATPLATATPAPLETASPTPSPTPTPAFGNLPQGEASDYQLQPWQAADALALAKAEEPPVFPRNDADQGYDSQRDWATVKLTLLREVQARFPGSSASADAHAELISPETYYSVSIPVESTLELFRADLETALNANPELEISAEMLAGLVSQQVDSLQVAGLFPAKNIFGDGQPGWIFAIRGDGYVSSFALSGSGGNYRLVSPDKNWRILYWGDQALALEDLNGNGIPELVVHDSYWGTGMTHYCGEVLHVYEWQTAGFVDLTPNLSTNAGTDSGGCMDFQFEPPVDGIQSISTGSWILSSCSTENAVGIGSTGLKRHYEWNGHFFALARAEILPLGADLASNPEIAHCRLNWVNEVGATNEQAYQALPGLLSKTDPQSVAGYTENFGPAYLDLFNFKLGTWSAMRGQQKRALTLLTQVRDHPANSDYDTASKLAAAFLQAYPEQSPYFGCLQANKVISIYDYPGGDFLDVEAMGRDWGFFDWQWAYGGGYTVLFNGMGMRSDTLNLCSLSDAFSLAVRRQSFSTTAGLTDWLKMQRIPFTGLTEGDLDGDGLTDWVVALGTGRNQRLDVWALLNQGNSIQPLLVKNLDTQLTNLPATWSSFTPTASAPRLNVYLTLERLLVFRVISTESGANVETVLDESPWDQSYLGFTFQPAETAASLPGAAELVIQKSGPGLAWQEDWDTYGWDNSLNTLVIVSTPEAEQKEQILKAEKLLFNDNQPAAALEILQQLLGDDPGLIEKSVDAYKNLPEIRPYLLYLRGVAEELSGDEAAAQVTYWTLWHDFPLHPYSYLVQQRLIPISTATN